MIKIVILIILFSSKIVSFGSLLEFLDEAKEEDVKSVIIKNEELYGKWIFTIKRTNKQLDNYYFYLYKSGLFIFHGIIHEGYCLTIGKQDGVLFRNYNTYENKIIGFQNFLVGDIEKNRMIFKDFESYEELLYQKEYIKQSVSKIENIKVEVTKKELEGEWILTDSSKKNIDTIIYPPSLPSDLKKKLNLTLSNKRKEELISSYLKIYKDGSCEIKSIKQNPSCGTVMVKKKTLRY